MSWRESIQELEDKFKETPQPVPARELRCLKCCVVGCDNDADFGILSEGQSSDMETQACEAHVGNLLEPGVSKVYPI